MKDVVSVDTSCTGDLATGSRGSLVIASAIFTSLGLEVCAAGSPIPPSGATDGAVDGAVDEVGAGVLGVAVGAICGVDFVVNHPEREPSAASKKNY